MEIADLLTADRVALNVRVRDKRGLIAEIARLASAHTPGLAAAAIEGALLAREQLGSTGVGAGVALPHARLDGLAEFVGLYVRPARAVDFDAIDRKPVDSVFLLLIPGASADHVSALAAVSRLLRDPDVRTRLREAASAADAWRILTQR
jgi:PTS system nitrogen regulatory IIA component